MPPRRRLNRSMETPQEAYIKAHTAPQGPALDWVERMTNIHTNYPRMLSGPVQGRLLTILVEAISARRVLEIGTFTGYSTIFMAQGLPEDGHVDSLEINDELEDLIRAGWERAGVSDKINLHIGDALQTLSTLSGPYDFVYMDANKREYSSYYELVLPLVRTGGLILADDVLWDGKPYETAKTDRQTLGIERFNDIVAADPRVEAVMLPLRHGLSLIRKR